MARISLCDICLTRHNKLTRAARYIRVKGRKGLRIDLCNVHSFEFRKKFPKVTVEYVQFIYEMAHKTKLSTEDARFILRNGR